MEKTLNLINEDIIAKKLANLMCGNVDFVEISSKHFWIPFHDTSSIINPNYPEHFPQCCDYHKGLQNECKQWYDKFPNCCSGHAKLATARWFKKENYSDISRKIVYQVHHTSNLIKTKIDNYDWYDDITDYIDYNVDSFGQFPEGYGSPAGLNIYLHNVRHCILDFFTKKFEYDPIKSKRLIEFIDSYYVPSNQSKIDINDLLTTYRNWTSAFPFEIDFFKPLKKYYSENLPILDGEVKFNRYKGTAKVKLQTKSSLVLILIDQTKKLLNSIDTTNLLRNNKISDTDKYKIDLVMEKHRIDQAKLLTEYSVSEKKYIDILRKWLVAEKDMFNEIEPLLQKRPTPNSQQRTTSSSRPIFQKEYLQEILSYLTPHFDEPDKINLKMLLETGIEVKGKLIFRDNGKRLGYAFKLLKESDMITSCSKQELEQWVIKNFRYVHNQSTKDFSNDYIEKCISRHDPPPKNPLFEIKNGKIIPIK